MFLVDGSSSITEPFFRGDILRFIKEFVAHFKIGPDETRVGFIQYSADQRYEFNMGQHKDKKSILNAISQIKYIGEGTLTGAGIKYMTEKGFLESQGARPGQDDVSRVAIVITDGDSQDEVTDAAKEARKNNITIFSIGVTDGVKMSELEKISGSSNQTFRVKEFKDLDTKLQALIQKTACSAPKKALINNKGAVEHCPNNEECVADLNGQGHCQCPSGFQRCIFSNTCIVSVPCSSLNPCGGNNIIINNPIIYAQNMYVFTNGDGKFFHNGPKLN